MRAFLHFRGWRAKGGFLAYDFNHMQVAFGGLPAFSGVESKGRRTRGSLHTPSRYRFASSRSRNIQSRHGCQDVKPLSYNTNEPRAEFSKQMPKCEDVVWKSSPPQSGCFEPVLNSLKHIWGNWSYPRASTVLIDRLLAAGLRYP